MTTHTEFLKANREQLIDLIGDKLSFTNVTLRQAMEWLVANENASEQIIKRYPGCKNDTSMLLDLLADKAVRECSFMPANNAARIADINAAYDRQVAFDRQQMQIHL